MKSICSILMSVYNSDKYLAMAIASVLRQSFTNWELIIVDDGSTDYSYFIAECFNDERIKVFRKMMNKGKSYAMEFALRQSVSDYVLELDADDWLERDALKILIKNMLVQPQTVGMIYGDRSIYSEVNGVLFYNKELPALNFSNKYDFLRHMQGIGPRFYRRSSLISCGGWKIEDWGDGRLYEDVDVILRLLERYEIKNIGYTGYNIRKHPNNTTKINRQNWWPSMQNMINYYVNRWGNEVSVKYDHINKKVVFKKISNTNN